MNKKRQVIFIGVAIFLLFFIIGFTVYSINFLAKTIKPVLEEKSADKPIIRFNFEGLTGIGLME